MVLPVAQAEPNRPPEPSWLVGGVVDEGAKGATVVPLAAMTHEVSARPPADRACPVRTRATLDTAVNGRLKAYEPDPAVVVEPKISSMARWQVLPNSFCRPVRVPLPRVGLVVAAVQAGL